MLALLAFSSVHVVVGGIQFARGDGFMPLPGLMRPAMYNWRASGFYIYPSHLAGLLEMTGLMALGMCFWMRGSVWLRVIIGYGAAACIGGIAITGSRGGYQSAVVGLFVLMCLNFQILSRVRPDLKKRLFIAAVLIFAGLLGTLFVLMMDNGALRGRLLSIYDPGNGRIELWKAAMQQWQLSPVVGTGSGTYLVYGRLFRSPAIQGDPVHVHCDYLEMLAEYGCSGVGSCVGFRRCPLGFRLSLFYDAPKFQSETRLATCQQRTRSLGRRNRGRCFNFVSLIFGFQLSFAGKRAHWRLAVWHYGPPERCLRPARRGYGSA